MALVTTSTNHPRLLASQDQKRAPAIRVFQPRNLKNADHDLAILKESAVVVSIPVDDQLYVGSERIKRGDFGFKLEQALKRQAEPNKIVYIAGQYLVPFLARQEYCYVDFPHYAPPPAEFSVHW